MEGFKLFDLPLIHMYDVTVDTSSTHYKNCDNCGGRASVGELSRTNGVCFECYGKQYPMEYEEE